MRKLLPALLLIAACQTPAATTSADVSVYEFGIDSTSTRLEAGEIALRVTNNGEYGHTLVITDAGGHVISAGDLIGPGESANLDLALDPGDYSFTCRIVAQDDDGNVIDHYEQGMSADITVA